jgi:site-specific recombinase XerD
MAITDAIINFRRFLKRRNHSPHTVKNYLNRLKHFVVWLDVPLEEVTSGKILRYIDHLLDRRLKPSTINYHLLSIRRFYDYLAHEEGVRVGNPVKSGYGLRLPKPLPRFLREEDLAIFLGAIRGLRDRAIFLLMLRSGLRVEEVANLTLDAIDLQRDRLLVRHGKGGKDRVVYLSPDTHLALVEYLQRRPRVKAKQIFLVEKGLCTGKPISVRGIQKRIEYYARKTRVTVSCHCLRHTMATQLLNADADLATIQDLLGHNWITTTQRYCKVSNMKVKRDYFKAIATVMQRTSPEHQP